MVPGRRGQLHRSVRMHGRANSFPRQVKQNEICGRKADLRECSTMEASEGPVCLGAAAGAGEPPLVFASLEPLSRKALSEPPSLRVGFRFIPGNLPAFQRSSVTTTTQRVSVSGITSLVGPPACVPARTLVETAYKIFVALKVGGRLNWEGQGLLGS